jgi:uncharacterized membrane protein YqjE
MTIGQEPSIADLIRTTIRDSQELVRTEIALAKAELQGAARRMAYGAAMLTGAAIAAVVAIVFLLTAVAWALPAALGWPAWSGFAAVGGVVLLLAAVLGLMGRSRLAATPRMPLTATTLKENMEWTRSRTS